MEAHLRCFECGRDLSAMPAYLGSLPGMRIRCSDCAEKAQEARPVLPMELTSPASKQLTLQKPHVRRPKEVTDDVHNQIQGLPSAA